VKLNNQNKYLIYNNLLVTEDSIKFNVASNNPDMVKVHVLGYNYLPSSRKAKFSKFEKTKNQSTTTPNDTYKIKQNSNSYLETKQLSDEIQYVLDRKNRKTYMGNTLDKPQVILNRQFNKKTSKEDVILNKGTDYKFKVDKMEKVYRNDIKKKMMGRYGDPQMMLTVSQLNAFLSHNGIVETNYKPDNHNNVIIS